MPVLRSKTGIRKELSNMFFKHIAVQNLYFSANKFFAQKQIGVTYRFGKQLVSLLG
jgi:hypothetical protein